MASQLFRVTLVLSLALCAVAFWGSSVQYDPSPTWTRMLQEFEPLGVEHTGKVVGRDIEGMGFGVIAIQDISKDEIFMTIPKSVTTMEDRILKRHPEWYVLRGRIQTTTIEALFFARTKLGLDNFENDVQKEYREAEYYHMSIIQECFDGLQMDKDSLQRLPPWSRFAIRKHQRIADLDWQMLKALPEAQFRTVNGEEYAYGVSKALYLDGLCSRWSRAFTIETSGASVPIADMFNHATDWNTLYYYDPDTQRMVLKAIKDVKAGQQMYDNYGENYVHPSTQFLAYYGFTEPMSLHTYFPNVTLAEVWMSYPVVRFDDPNKAIKMKLLQDHYERVVDMSPYFYQPPVTKSFMLGHKHFRDSDIGLARLLLLRPENFTSVEAKRRLDLGLGNIPSMIYAPTRNQLEELNTEDKEVVEFLCQTCHETMKELKKIFEDPDRYGTLTHAVKFYHRKQFLMKMASRLFDYHYDLVNTCLDTYLCE